MAASPPVRVLLIDPSALYRHLLVSVISNMPGAVLAGEASDGKGAIGLIAKTPVDVVLLHVEDAVRENAGLIQRIRQSEDPPEVVVMVSADRLGSEMVEQSLEAGAMDIVYKPEAADLDSVQRELEQRLTALFQNVAPKDKASVPKPRAFHIDAVVIAVSTGGPNALHEVIPSLPQSLGLPILVVQHMPSEFTPSFAKALNQKSGLVVKEAEAGEAIMADTVYIAPGGRHLRVSRVLEGKGKAKYHIQLTDEAPENSCRPSADVLFRSAVEAYGQNLLAVVMTGMGNDGAMGVLAIKQAGGYCLAQSEKTCVVYGMPRAVCEMGLADEVVDLDQLAHRIARLVALYGRSV